ncbi:hypothetical protein [Nitrolancea hollandica]|uniref:Uncharacterized protein n=1 Tax=Nitrolancea hollandica Lb TaxID=1129897 RepID=I4EMC0_9BACT|nr:hypothetical protein [Nitrolancea hollandica]CCF85833.1 hypothetical protein NITHO_5880002 [Nitrolancea hollandica Lb]
MRVVDRNEVLLYGTRFPLAGPVQRSLNSPFPAKMTIGDYTRNDQEISSTWITADAAGGIGKNAPDLPTDQDRIWFGDLETRYRKQLTLGPLVTKAGNLTGPADVLIDLSERLYAAVGQSVYRWDETTGTWSTVTTALAGVPEQACVFDGLLYFISNAGLDWYNVNTNTWGQDVAAGGSAMVVYDGKLFRLHNNVLYWSIDPPSGTWDANGSLSLPAGYCKQLVVYPDLTGEAAIHAVTRVGLYALDFDAARFYETPLTYPVAPKAITGAAVWRGDLYIPVDRELYKYNQSVHTEVGPDRDDGLPATVRGEIRQVVPGHGFYYIVMNVVQPKDPNVPIVFDVSQPRNDTFFSQVHSSGAVLVSPGTAWHTVQVDPQVGAGMGSALVASIEGTYRLWFSTGTGIFYVDVGTGLHNPLQSPTFKFKQTGYLETFLFDAGWVELDKLALGIEISAKQVTNTEVIRVFIDWDDSGVWQRLGTVTRNGKTSFRIGGDDGRLFRMVRLRIEMERGDDPTKTPILQGLVFSFMLRPNPIWGWALTIDCSTPYKNHSPQQLREKLLNIVGSKLAGTLVYRDDFGRQREARVVPTDLRASELTGADDRGKFLISLTEVESANA